MFHRGWVLGLVIGLLCGAPATAQEAPSAEVPLEAPPATPSALVASSFSHLEWHTLDNGLLVVLDPNPEVSSVTVAIGVGVAQRDVPPGWSGLAHLAEHLFFRARSEGELHFIDRLERLGVIEANGMTQSDRTVYFETIPSEALDEVLWLEADRFTNTLQSLDAEAIRLERDIVHRERTLRDDATTLAPTLVQRILYAGHAYADTGRERPGDLDAIGLPQMQAFMQQAYTPDRMTLAVSGNFNPEQTLGRIRALFSGLQQSASPWPRADVSIPRVAGERRLLVDVPRPHDALMVIWPTPPFGLDEDAALDLLARTLETRLREALIQRGRGYEVSVTQSSRDLASEFVVYIEVPRRSGTLIPLEALDAQLGRLYGVPLDEVELAHAKTAMERRWVQGLSSTKDRALALTRRPPSMQGQRYDPLTDLARYQMLDSETLRRTALHWLPRNGRLVVSLDARPGVPYEGVLVRDMIARPVVR